MYEYLSIGKTLFHKYLGNVTVKQIDEERIKAETVSRGVLEFAFYDFGKVLFFEKEHEVKSFQTNEEYKAFCEKDKRIKIELEAKADQECERLKLKEMQEFESEKELERDWQSLIDEEKKKREQLHREKLLAVNSEPVILKSTTWYQLIDINPMMGELSPKRETLLSIKKEEEIKIKAILDRRKIRYCVHFTRMDNLNSILSNGLIPVSIQNKKGMDSLHNDEQRIDTHLDCTSCSVTFPNYKLFSKFSDYKFPGSTWVMIVLSTDILLSPNNVIYFCHTNAASVVPRCLDVKDLCTANSFESMFCETKTIKGEKIINRASLQVDDCITTDPQAEILVSDIIEPEFIKGIYFQRQNHADSYFKANGLDLLKKYECKIHPDFFSYEVGYMLWNKEY